MRKFIPLSVPNLKGNELKYVTEAIETEWVSTGGGYINKFENDIAKYLNVSGAVAVQSGTAGIHLALELSGVEIGDEVIVPTLTFIAAINPVKYLGANPIFMDCDDSLTMDPNKLREFIELDCYFKDGILINKNTENKIKAIIVVHVFGNIANMQEIMSIAERYNLKVIEDATEALGSKFVRDQYAKKYAGTIGDFGVYSFNGNKIITTGGGGMIVAKEEANLDKAKYLSTQSKDDELYYVHNEIGYNYRMTNVQAAIGVAQLEQLENFIKLKKENYNLYREQINKIDNIELLDFSNGIEPNYWFYSVRLSGKLKKEVYNIIKKLNELGVQTRPIWKLNHTQKPYKNNIAYSIEKAYEYVDSIINIPCSSNLNKEDVIYVVDMLKKL